MRPIIRPMVRSDIPTLARWLVDVPLWQRYGLTVAKAESSLEGARRAGDITLVAEDLDPTDTAYGTTCGLAWCLPHGAFGRSAYLRLLGVRDGYQRHGTGAALLDEVEQQVRALGQDLVLLVSDFNDSAQRFYERQGYTRAGTLAGYVLPDVTELIYWKRLNPLVGQGGAPDRERTT